MNSVSYFAEVAALESDFNRELNEIETLKYEEATRKIILFFFFTKKKVFILISYFKFLEISFK